MHALVALALISALDGDTDQPSGADQTPTGGHHVPVAVSEPGASEASGGNESGRGGLNRVRAYVSQPRPRSARFLDHGDIAIGVAGGTPEIYRLDLRVGLFDHVSIGVTGHWLPGQRVPQLWPVGAIAFWRFVGAASGVGFEVGAHYRPVLHPPVDPEQTFIPLSQFALGSMVVSAGPFSGGLDAGAAHVRIPVADPAAPTDFDRRTVFGGGVFARIGTRRIGVTADAVAALGPEPLLVFELMLDVRLGAFSERDPKGHRAL